MKKLILLAILAITGCSKIESNQIVGGWVLNERHLSYQDHNPYTGEVGIIHRNSTTFEQPTIWRFEKNGVGYIDGEVIFWEISNGDLFITNLNKNTTSTYIIQSRSKKELHIKIEAKYEGFYRENYGDYIREYLMCEYFFSKL